MSQIIDSDRRCPFDSKRMLVEIGQDMSDSAEMVGWVRMVHFCLNCEYTEIDENWKRPRLVVLQGGRRTGAERTGAERLRALRMGVEIPLVYDETPFPAGDLA